MKLSKVIELLQKIEEKHGGDIPIFVNGEYGENEPEPAIDEWFAVGKAYETLGDRQSLPKGINVDDVVMQIGAYEIY